MKAYLEIEMPKNCNECPLHSYEGQAICCCCVLPTIEDDEILKPWKNKRKDCPLVPVPPHGDLIARDALYTELAKRKSYGELSAKSALRAVANAPTIIPASEEGE